jgi:cytochrome c oxidase subunit 4
MRHSININLLWALMMVLTLITYAIGDLGLGGPLAVISLLLSAAIKGSFIIRDFMDLRGVSLLWRWIMYGWLGFVTIAIALSYLISIV